MRSALSDYGYALSLLLLPLLHNADALEGAVLKCFEPQPWKAAVQHCESLGLSLLTIRNEQDVQQAIDNAEFIGNTDWAGPAYGFTWLGLNDQSNEGCWYWSSQLVMDYENWARGQPEIRDEGLDCAAMIKGPAVGGQWMSVACDTPLPYCCEGIPENIPSAEEGRGVWQDPQVSRPADKACPAADEGAFTCFDAQEWFQAQETCRFRGESMVSVYRKQDNDYAVRYARFGRSPRPDDQGEIEMTWLGFHDHSREGAWYWESEAAVNFTNWAPGQPARGAGVEDCAVLVKGHDLVGEWMAIPCDSRIPFCCTASPGPGEGQGHYGEPEAKQVWHDPDFGEARLQCFETGKDWHSAQQHCASLGEGMSLLEILDSDANAYARRVASFDRNPLWTRVPHLRDRTVTWLGLSDLKREGHWSWASGALLGYTNWVRAEPSNSGDGENCAVMDREGLWMDVDCVMALPYCCSPAPFSKAVTVTGQVGLTVTRPEAFAEDVSVDHAFRATIAGFFSVPAWQVPLKMKVSRSRLLSEDSRELGEPQSNVVATYSVQFENVSQAEVRAKRLQTTSPAAFQEQLLKEMDAAEVEDSLLNGLHVNFLYLLVNHGGSSTPSTDDGDMSMAVLLVAAFGGITLCACLALSACVVARSRSNSPAKAAGVPDTHLFLSNGKTDSPPKPKEVRHSLDEIHVTIGQQDSARLSEFRADPVGCRGHMTAP